MFFVGFSISDIGSLREGGQCCPTGTSWGWHTEEDWGIGEMVGGLMVSEVRSFELL